MEQFSDKVITTRNALGDVPKWLSRYGIIVVISVFSLFVYLCSIIAYPMSNQSNITIHADKLEVVHANSHGKFTIQNFYDGQEVKKNSVIGSIGPGDVSKILELKEFLSKGFEAGGLEKLKSFTVSNNELGELKETYAQFIDKISDIESSSQILVDIELRLNRIKKAIDIQIPKAQYADKYAKSSNESFAKKNLKYEETLIDLLSDSKGIESQVKIVGQLIQSILEGNSLIDEEGSELYELECKLMIKKIEDWEKAHVIRSPINGFLVIDEPLLKGKNVDAGEPVLFVSPLSNNSFIAEMELPNNIPSTEDLLRSSVKVKFDNHADYGDVAGSLSTISKESERDGFYCNISFPNGLKTASGYQVPFKDGMTGKVVITTADVSLLDRALLSTASILRGKR